MIRDLDLMFRKDISRCVRLHVFSPERLLMFNIPHCSSKHKSSFGWLVGFPNKGDFKKTHILSNNH